MASQLFNVMRRLQWGDFGKPVDKPAPSPGVPAAAAYTETNFTYSANAEYVRGTSPAKYRLKDDVRVMIKFQRPPISWIASWVPKQPEQEQKRLLHHEQGHYDLVALLGRDMFNDITRIKQKTYDTPQAVVTEVDQIPQRYEPQIQPVQDRYDADTNHGLDQKQQTRWDAFIQQAFTQQQPLLTVLQLSHIIL